MRFIIMLSASYLFIISYVACSSSNAEQIEQIIMLETNTKNDITNLSSIDINELNNNLKVAELNLLKLENKQLDSISIELIYFQYRDYLNCISSIRTCIKENNRLKKELETNRIQLSNLKLDYQSSQKKRLDLDKHLMHETKFAQQTSKSIINLIKKMKDQIEQFDILNNNIEAVINE